MSMPQIMRRSAIMSASSAAYGSTCARKPIKRYQYVSRRESPVYGCLWQNPPSVNCHHRPTMNTDLPTLDRTDRAILQALQHDGRIANSLLAEKVSLSESACLRRVRALEASGLIDGYAAVINQERAGYPVNVFVNITLDRQDQTDLSAFEKAVRQIPEVMECYLMTGNFDYLLRVVVTNTADFERLHSQHLTRLPHVSRVNSSVALRTVQKARELPIK